MAKKINRRLNLVVPRSLLLRLDEELIFLGIGQRVVVIEEREISKRNEFVRLCVTQYCDRFNQGTIEPQDYEDDETDLLPFYLDRQSEAKWNIAIKDGAAISYNQLVTMGLWNYFERQQTVAAIVKQKAIQCKELLKSVDLNQLRELLLA